MPFGFYYNPYWWVVIPGILLALWAQWRVTSTYQRYSQVAAAAGFTGAQVAEAILEQNGVPAAIEPSARPGDRGQAGSPQVVRIQPIGGTLSDHYDPRNKVLGLSEGVYAGRSLAALGVAAHETGHALQDAHGYAPMALRSALVPLATIGTNAAIFIALIGFVLGATRLIDLGILLFTGYLLFALVTLPVEFNASSRAVAALQRGGFVHPQEVQGVRAVLNAAAMTYVAAAAGAVLQLVQLVLLRGSSRD